MSCNQFNRTVKLYSSVSVLGENMCAWMCVDVCVCVCVWPVIEDIRAEGSKHSSADEEGDHQGEQLLQGGQHLQCLRSPSSLFFCEFQLSRLQQDVPLSLSVREQLVLIERPSVRLAQMGSAVTIVLLVWMPSVIRMISLWYLQLLSLAASSPPLWFSARLLSGRF